MPNISMYRQLDEILLIAGIQLDLQRKMYIKRLYASITHTLVRGVFMHISLDIRKSLLLLSTKKKEEITPEEVDQILFTDKSNDEWQALLTGKIEDELKDFLRFATALCNTEQKRDIRQILTQNPLLSKISLI